MRRAVPPPPVRPPGPVMWEGLDAHLADAIRLNRARRAGYVARGGVRAALLSRALVGAERALRPAARWLDRRAAPFWAVGVPILAAELSDMTAAPPAEQAVGGVDSRAERDDWNGVSSPRQGEGGSGSTAPPASSTTPGPSCPGGELADGLRPRPNPPAPLGLRPARRALRAGRLRACAEAIGSAVDVGRGGALTRHVLESAGLMALRGVAYARETDGATAPLSRDLVRGHLALVPFARVLDRLAAPLWARGVGLFANDLPPIPFEELRATSPPRPASRARAHV